jgi:hypothetical protein
MVGLVLERLQSARNYHPELEGALDGSERFARALDGSDLLHRERRQAGIVVGVGW